MGAITVGIGLMLTLVSGFGLIAKLGLGFPGWIFAKLTIWIIIGGFIAVINRNRTFGLVFWWLAVFLGCIAAFLAVVQPF